MEEAKQLIHELRDVHEGVSAEDIKSAREQGLDEYLKPEINNLLLQYLPEDITIKNAEILATVIYQIVRFPEDFLKK